MSRIARAALSILADGPVAVADLGRQLACQGITRARDPGAAVRRALRDDPRVVTLPDGRMARVDSGLDGVVLTTRVTREARDRGELDLDGDLAPLALLGVRMVPLPDDVPAGALVAVTVVPGPESVTVVPVARARARAQDEDSLGQAVSARLARTNAGLSSAAPVARLAPLFLAVAAADPAAFRAPGRPLTEALRERGWDVHLGWTGGVGTQWTTLTEEEIDTLEADVALLLVAERPGEAAAVQERVVSVLRRHLPERMPAGRRRLARVLARAGRPEDALSVLTGAFRFDDPEDYYEAAVLATRMGDVTSARRWVNEGLARTPSVHDDDVTTCLDDIAGDLDARAAFLAVRDWMPRADDPDGIAGRLVDALVTPRRSYLVEALVEEAFEDVDTGPAMALIAAMARTGDAGRDACLACAAVLPPPLGTAARQAAGGRARGRRPWVDGLVAAAPTGAWTTSLRDAPDQQQMIITVRKEQGRVSPLVVLIDHEQMDGAVKDAFFLPDLAVTRVRRELFAPMAELGLPSRQLDLGVAVQRLGEGLSRARSRGWELPSAARQPVVERIGRWVLSRRDDLADEA